MAAISTTNYRNIVAYYTKGLQQVQGVSDHYYDAAYEIVMLQVFIPEIDLLIPFYQGYLASSTAYTNPPASVVTAIRALQSHVLAQQRDADDNLYADINEYLADTTLWTPAYDGVSEEFAAVSAQAGYAIDASNIDPDYDPDTEAAL